MDTLSTETYVNQVNPEIVQQIVAVYAAAAAESPDVSFEELVYLCTKSVLRKTARIDIDVLFVYYLQTYRTLIGSAQPELRESPHALSHAALSLFTLHATLTKRHLPALLLRRAVKALIQVILEIVSHDDTVLSEDVLTFGTNLTIIGQTIDYYTAPVRIHRYLAYLEWLRKFIIACLTQTPDSLLLLDRTLTAIAVDAKNRRPLTLFVN